MASAAVNGRDEAIVIGSGQAGTPLAEAFANAGRRTALVEREHVGGTCVNVGCTPTKTMVARAEETGETRGFMKAVVDAGTDLVPGCAILGIEGGEQMAVLQIAMMGKLLYPVLREAIFAHSTLAESLNGLFSTVA